MSKNPKRALAAVTASGERVNGILVREITLGLAAVLERIESPLVVGVSGDLKLADLLPTIFVMTRPAVDSERILAEGGLPALRTAAVVWADEFPTQIGKQLAAACYRAARRVANVSPSGMPQKEGAAEGNGKSAGTAG